MWRDRQRQRLGSLAAVRAGVEARIGNGPRVVLIHGVGLRAEAWEAQIDRLAERHEVIAVDMPGHGESPRLHEGASLQDFGDAIAAAVLEAPTVFVGHSMGGMLALDLAVRFPQRVRGVVALNAIHRRDPAAKVAVATRVSQLDGQSVPDPEPTLRRWFGTHTSVERKACDRWLRTVDPAGYRAAYSVFAAEDGPDDAALTGLRCPALFITGADEANSTPAMSARMAALAPGGRVEIIEGAAHMMPMTHGAEICELLLDYLRASGP